MEKFPNDVRIVWKNNALPFHNRAMPAAQAAMAAQPQGKFWEFHDKIFANQKALDDATLEKYATELGLDIPKWKAAMAGTKGLIEKDMALAGKLNARGTPNFFVNGRNLRGAVPYENFEGLIKAELAKAQKLVAAGTPAKDVYALAIAKGKTFEPLDSKVNTFTYEGRPFKGAANGDIVITEYSDFQCLYCSRIAPAMKKLADAPELKGRIKVVFKHFPLNFHKQAKPAAIAAMAAHQQGKFWEMHDKIFADFKSLSADKLKQWATEIGLDIAKYDAYLASGAGAKIVEEDMKEARAAGLRGTPTVYINGRKYQGRGYSPSAIKKLADTYLKK